MKRFVALVSTLAAMAAPVLADGTPGDPAKGEKAFKKCKACHAIVADNGAGEVIFKGGKTGPNLWGLPGRTAGSYPEFKYSPSLAAAGSGGLVWSQAEFEGFVQDPKAYLQQHLDDPKAKSRMTYKLKKGAADVWAYIESVSPPVEAPAASSD